MSATNSQTLISESKSGMLNAILATASIAFLLFIVHRTTVYSIVTKWYESETFSHGFFIFPIALYLVWRCRERLLSLNPSTSTLGLTILFLLSVAWFLAHAANILVVQQFTVIAMIPALVWVLLGRQIVNEIKFPLFYLIFAVPMGEVLIPYLMDYTAVFTVEALRLSGIPVYRDGMFFSTSAGNFEVAVACSGIRYLIASIALGTLYAYLSYQTLYRRAVFILFSILVPILANGVRAYGIVVIAHLSDMQQAVSVDHIIYGWLFFGFVMLLLFLAGSTFRDKTPNYVESAPSDGGLAIGKNDQSKLLIMSVISVGLIVAGPVIVHNQAKISADTVSVDNEYQLPSGRGSWAGPEEISGTWFPSIHGANSASTGRYTNGLSAVDAVVFHYDRQDQGVEMVSSLNRVYDEKQWSFIDEYSVQVELENGETFNVIATEVRSMNQNRLVWHWYNVSGSNTASRYMEKLYEVLAVLFGQIGGAYVALISTEYDTNRSEAEQVLREYLKDNHQSLLCCMSGEDCCIANGSNKNDL